MDPPSGPPTTKPSVVSSSESYTIADPLSLQPARSLVTSTNLRPTGLFFINLFSSSTPCGSSGSRVWSNVESTSWKLSSDSELSSLYVVVFRHSRKGRLSASLIYIRSTLTWILGRFSPGLALRQVCSMYRSTLAQILGRFSPGMLTICRSALDVRFPNSAEFFRRSRYAHCHFPNC